MGVNPQGDSFRRNLGRIFGTYTGGLVAFVILLAVLEQLGLPDSLIGYLFVAATFAVYAGIGIVARTVSLSDYYVAGRRVPAVYNGMATAADWISGASFVGMAGTLYVLGYDGLAFVVGWSGGFILVATLIAPYLRKLGAYTVPDFLGARFGGNIARLVGIIVLLACSFTYVVAQIYSTGLIASRFLGISFEFAVYVGLGGILFCSLFGGMRAVTWTQVAQYIVLIIAYMLPVLILSAQKYGFPIAQLTYGRALQEIAGREQEMVATGLASGEVLKSYIEPFTSLDRTNFFALIACLMIGTASLPHLLMRFFTTSSVRQTRRSVGWSLLFIALLYVTAPAYAAFAKLEVYQNVIGASLDALPEWIYTYGRLGLVDVCGISATTADAVRAACAEIPGHGGVLRLGDFSIDRDVVLIATPEIAGLPYVIAGLVAAGGLAASISTADGLLLAIANTLSHDVYYRMVDRKAPSSRRLVIARFLLLAAAAVAAWAASTRPADILSIVAWAFSLAAAGNFPALVLGIWWKRCTSAGAVAGMVAGFGVTLYYLVMTQYFGMPEWFGVNNISAAVFGLPVGFAVTIAVSLVTRKPSAETEALVDAMRRPSGDPVMGERSS
ncbi:cation acetate symporter [Stappia sp. F7233]|uniref:Cation acetate symporter n=1 Tax=Stappia albiluteola TaxID=2758565 RepID=A0A839AH04_9HYPH|nr:sodium:solute symporter family protein [Stappia albiluteola]MBA5779140.1 cation acetate symporter [Stappia albiluteola]